MHSDNWLKLGYKHGERIIVSPVIDYEIWTDSENSIVGVTVNFEEADDYHYELPIEEWMKFLEKVLKNINLENTQKLFEKFLHENNKMFDFQDALKLHGIEYDKIAFY
jgi:4-alpha-glucanotransferase